MRSTPRSGRRRHPRGAAAVEFAAVLPLLCFLLVGCVDFCRLFYHHVTVTNCARNGALYACDRTAELDSPYFVLGQRLESVRRAALADASNLSPTPTVQLLADGPTVVRVRVSFEFRMVSGYLGFGATFVNRTVEMRVAPALPG